MENGTSSSANGKAVDSMSIGSVGSQDGSCGLLETTGLTLSNCADLILRVCVFLPENIVGMYRYCIAV